MQLTKHLLTAMIAIVLAYAPKAMAQVHMPDMQQDQKKVAPVDSTAGVNVTYRCPMDPDVVSNTPGKCPKCGMALQKLTPQAASAGPVHRSTKMASGSCCPAMQGTDSTDVKQDRGNM